MEVEFPPFSVTMDLQTRKFVPVQITDKEPFKQKIPLMILASKFIQHFPVFGETYPTKLNTREIGFVVIPYKLFFTFTFLGILKRYVSQFVNMNDTDPILYIALFECVKSDLNKAMRLHNFVFIGEGRDFIINPKEFDDKTIYQIFADLDLQEFVQRSKDFFIHFYKEFQNEINEMMTNPKKKYDYIVVFMDYNMGKNEFLEDVRNNIKPIIRTSYTPLKIKYSNIYAEYLLGNKQTSQHSLLAYLLLPSYEERQFYYQITTHTNPNFQYYVQTFREHLPYTITPLHFEIYVRKDYDEYYKYSQYALREKDDNLFYHSFYNNVINRKFNVMQILIHYDNPDLESPLMIDFHNGQKIEDAGALNSITEMWKANFNYSLQEKQKYDGKNIFLDFGQIDINFNKDINTASIMAQSLANLFTRAYIQNDDLSFLRFLIVFTYNYFEKDEIRENDRDIVYPIFMSIYNFLVYRLAFFYTYQKTQFPNIQVNIDDLNYFIAENTLFEKFVMIDPENANFAITSPSFFLGFLYHLFRGVGDDDGEPSFLEITVISTVFKYFYLILKEDDGPLEGLHDNAKLVKHGLNCFSFADFIICLLKVSKEQPLKISSILSTCIGVPVTLRRIQNATEVTQRITKAKEIMIKKANRNFFNAIRMYGFILFTPEMKSRNYSNFVQLFPLSEVIVNDVDVCIINNFLAICSQYVEDYVKHIPDIMPNSDNIYQIPIYSWLDYDGNHRSNFIKYLNTFSNSGVKIPEKLEEIDVIKEIICLSVPFEVRNILLAKAELAFRLNLSGKGTMNYLFPGHVLENDFDSFEYDEFFDPDTANKEQFIIRSCMKRETIDQKKLFEDYGEIVYLLTKIFSHDSPNLSSPIDIIFYSRFFYISEVRKFYEESFNSLFTNAFNPFNLMFILKGAITTASDPSTRFYEPGENIFRIPECFAFLFMTSIFDQIDYCPSFSFMKQIMLNMQKNYEFEQIKEPYALSFLFGMKERYEGLYQNYPFPIRESSPFKYYHKNGNNVYNNRSIPFVYRYDFLFYRRIDIRKELFLIRFYTSQKNEDHVFCDFIIKKNSNVDVHHSLLKINEALLKLIFKEIFKIVPWKSGLTIQIRDSLNNRGKDDDLLREGGDFSIKNEKVCSPNMILDKEGTINTIDLVENNFQKYDSGVLSYTENHLSVTFTISFDERKLFIKFI